jgi:uncharacterized protein YxjI
MAAKAGERYTIRRQVFRLFGAGFHIYDAQGGLVGYCDQKRFRLREDLRVYTDESKSEELLRIGTEQIIDFGATYTVRVPTEGGAGEAEIGAFRRKGMKSFLRDEWIVMGPSGEPVGTIREDSQFKALVRRAHELLAAMTPQAYHLRDNNGVEVATFRTHFNPFVHRLGVAIHREDEVFDDLLALAAGVLLLAIEGRQD